MQTGRRTHTAEIHLEDVQMPAEPISLIIAGKVVACSDNLSFLFTLMFDYVYPPQCNHHSLVGGHWVVSGLG
jgi:hypothetical protein